MNAFRIAAALAMLACAGLSPAQDSGRASTPPGVSQDGSSASEGAIKGGSIQPGESSGATPGPVERDPREAPPAQNPR